MTPWLAAARTHDRALATASAAALTYPEVGRSGEAVLPAGWATREQVTALATRDLDGAAERLLGWDLQRALGLRVLASTPRAEVGAVVVTATPGPLALLVPCRVVHLVDEPDRRGFAYGKLPGHPLRGEEQFTLERDEAGRVALRLRSFSRVAGPFRAAPVLARAAQDLVNGRYGRAARRLFA